MSRLLLEIYPEHRPGVDGGGDLPAVLISTRGDEGAFATREAARDAAARLASERALSAFVTTR